MKFELNDNLMGKIIGISVAAAMAVTVAIGAEIINIRENTKAIDRNDSTMAENNSDFNTGNTTIIPFDDNAEDNNGSYQSSNKLKEIYDELVRSELLEGKSVTEAQNTTSATTASTTSTTASSAVSSETVITTTAAAETTATAPAQTEPAISNGQREFNYDDVSAIAADLKTLRDFVEELNPTSFCWDASEYAVNGYVKVSLLSAYGNVTLDVKPLLPFDGEQYTIEGQVTGGMNSSSITEWDWYVQNKESGCSICSVTWFKEEFAIAPERDIRIGDSITDVTENYLCVNGGANTLYEATDVLTDQTKLNALLASENAYTFIGGRIYSTESYIEKYYSDKENAYRFADSDCIIQYGCNSIMDHNYTAGSWIIEYAIKDDQVIGMTFMNKSYYEQAEEETPGEEDTASTTSSKSFFEQLFGGK